MNKAKIIFSNKAFCFTGKMAEMKRSEAEREARLRGAQIVDSVNDKKREAETRQPIPSFFRVVISNNLHFLFSNLDRF